MIWFKRGYVGGLHCFGRNFLVREVKDGFIQHRLIGYVV